MYASTDSIITGVISNVISILIIRMTSWTFRLVILEVTPVRKNKVRIYVKTIFESYFSRLKSVVGAVLNDLMN